MTEIILLAVALSMDAFAVSLTMGVSNPKNIQKLALTAGVYFGVFQGIMPLFGYLGGVAIFGWVGNFAHWIAFVLLLIIGLKMIYEAVTSRHEEDQTSKTYPHYAFLVLAIATSIDALAAGFSLPLMSVNGLYACLIIAITTFLFSYAGVTMGRQTAHWLGNKAEIFGGLVLIALGFKILLV
jgi:putative Mn2+ efflux pump MntP